ncbi:MAG: 30S ribosomal protein S6 [Candidatus Dormiibacterota bacterium]
MPARDYEILYIVKPDLDDEAVAEAVKSVDALIVSFGGTSQKTDVWGRRKLAYEVQHLREGHYILTDFQFDPDRVPELEGALRISDTVFRHLITRKPERTQRGKRPVAAAPAAEPTAAATDEIEEPTAAAAEPAVEPTAAAPEPESEPTPAATEPETEPTAAAAEPADEPTAAASEPESEPTTAGEESEETAAAASPRSE